MEITASNHKLGNCLLDVLETNQMNLRVVGRDVSVGDLPVEFTKLASCRLVLSSFGIGIADIIRAYGRWIPYMLQVKQPSSKW